MIMDLLSRDLPLRLSTSMITGLFSRNLRMIVASYDLGSVYDRSSFHNCGSIHDHSSSLGLSPYHYHSLFSRSWSSHNRQSPYDRSLTHKRGSTHDHSRLSIMSLLKSWVYIISIVILMIVGSLMIITFLRSWSSSWSSHSHGSTHGRGLLMIVALFTIDNFLTIVALMIVGLHMIETLLTNTNFI